MGAVFRPVGGRCGVLLIASRSPWLSRSVQQPRSVTAQAFMRYRRTSWIACCRCSCSASWRSCASFRRGPEARCRPVRPGGSRASHPISRVHGGPCARSTDGRGLSLGWRTEVTQGTNREEGAPPWRWTSVVKLTGRHEVGYLPHCHRPADRRAAGGVGRPFVKAGALIACQGALPPLQPSRQRPPSSPVGATSHACRRWYHRTTSTGWRTPLSTRPREGGAIRGDAPLRPRTLRPRS
jgi:hypothetical protein